MTLQVLSLLAVVASVLVLAWQTKQVATATTLASKTAVAAAMSDTTAHVRAVLQTLLTYPELRPFIFGGESLPLSGQELARAQTLCEMLFDSLEVTLEVVANLPGADSALTGWSDYAESVPRDSPGSAAHVSAHPNWYPRLAALWRNISDPHPAT
jgi:hypothetical protein